MKFFVMAATILLSTQLLAQNSVVVNSLGDNVEEDGVTTLREAILLANETEAISLITFSPGTFSSPDSVITIKERLPDINKTGFSLAGLTNSIRIMPHPEASFMDTVLKVSGKGNIISYLSFEDFYSGLVYTVLGCENSPDLTLNNLQFKNCFQAAAFTGPAGGVNLIQSTFTDCENGLVFNGSVTDFSASLNYTEDMYDGFLTFYGPAVFISIFNNQFNYNSDNERLVRENEPVAPLARTGHDKPTNRNPDLKPEQIKLKESIRPSRTVFANPYPEGKVFNSGYLIDFSNTVSEVLIKGNEFNGLGYPLRISGELPSAAQSVATSSGVKIIENKIESVYSFLEMNNTDDFLFMGNIISGSYTSYSYFLNLYNGNKFVIEQNLFGLDSYPTYYPLYVEEATDIQVTDNHFAYVGTAVYLSDVEGFIANENLFGFVDNEAIELYNVSGISIFNNLFEYSEDEAIYMSGCVNADIYENSFEFMEDGTLYAYETDGVTFTRNRVKYADWGALGYYYYSTNLLLEENQLSYISCEPVYFEYCENMTVRKHQFTTGYCEFIYIYRSSNALIEENWFSKTDDEFIYSYDSYGLTIRKNIFQENYYDNAIYIYNYLYGSGDSGAEFVLQDSVNISDNIFSQIGYSPIYIYHENDTTRSEIYSISHNLFDRYGINGGGEGVAQSVQSGSPAIQVNNYGLSDSYEITGNRFESGGSPVYLYGNFTEVNFNYNNIQKINGSGFYYDPIEEPIIVDATNNFWDSPFGPNDTDSTEGDTLNLYNDNPDGLWVSPWVNWQNYLTAPLDLGGNPVIIREISHPLISHRDTSEILLRGFDFSKVKSVFLGPVEATIDGKTSSLMGLIIVDPVPGHHPLIFNSEGKTDTVHKAIYVMNEVPPPPIMIGPGPGAQGVTSQPVFTWNPVADPDGDGIEYVLSINKGEPGSLTGEVSFRFKTMEISFKMPEHLDLGSEYFWTVTAQDEFGWYAEKAQWLNFTPVVFSSVEENPIRYEMSQNYPNPFNPSTTIRFSLVQPQHVKLSVYDATGRMVQVLVDGMRPAGFTSVDFNAAGLSSGLYFYKMEAGPLQEIRKMMLVK